jgi:anti-sigma regulatory factor (Ser/Thr protein kinase)
MTTDPEQSAAAGARLSLNLPPVLQAAGMARRALRDALRSWQLDHLADTALLLVSELVGNAIRHAQADESGLELRLATDGKRLRIEVLDPDRRTPTVGDPGPLDESGFGLVLVQALADEWGVRQLAIGKAVWVALRTLHHSGYPHLSPNGHANVHGFTRSMRRGTLGRRDVLLSRPGWARCAGGRGV